MRRWLLYALLFTAWTAEAPVERDTVLFCARWRSPFAALGWLFVPVPGIRVFPWQILLLLLLPLAFLGRRRFRSREAPMDAAIVVSAASLALTFLWGAVRGASLHDGYYQVWRFLAGLVVGLVVPAVLQRAGHLQALGTTVLAAALTRGALAAWFYWEIVRAQGGPPPPYMTNHDDSLLFVAGALVALAWALARRTVAAGLGALAVWAAMLYVIVLNNRRLAWIELVLALAVAYLALPRGRLNRRVHQFLLVAAPATILYVAVGLDRPEPVFAPLRALSTAGSYGDNSSLAREEEIRNLVYTLSLDGNPLLGTGWGRPYQKFTSVFANFDAVWKEYLYLPHNSLIALAAFGGLAGLAGIWCVVPVAAFLAMRGYRAARAPVEAAAALAALALLPAYGAQCYGDIGFESLTCGLLLGVALGTAATVSAWTSARPGRSRGRAARPAIAIRTPRPGGHRPGSWWLTPPALSTEEPGDVVAPAPDGPR